jgi:hypothetical protein
MDITPGIDVRRKHILEEDLLVVAVGHVNAVILNEIGVYSVTPVAGFWDRYETI